MSYRTVDILDFSSLYTNEFQVNHWDLRLSWTLCTRQVYLIIGVIITATTPIAHT